MRIVLLVSIASLLVLFTTGNALADATAESFLHQPASVQQTAFAYDDYAYMLQDESTTEPPDAAPSEAPEPVVGETQEKSLSVDVTDELGSCASSCGQCATRRSGCGHWTLPQSEALACRGIDVGGWLSGGLYSNAHGASNNGPLGFNTLGNGFTFNQLWVYAERATDTGGYGTDIGFRFDYLFGVDGPDDQAFGDGGWDFGWDSSSDYGSAIPQLYVELAYNDLKVKLGHFHTIIGWEVVPAPENFFYTHAYTMYYGEPFTHTGILASWAANDRVTVHGGWTMGWDSGFENLNEGSTFLGGVSTELTDNATLTWAFTAGRFGDGSFGADGDVYMNSLVFELALTDRLTYILQHDLGDNSDLGAGDNEWYGINQYLQFELNDCWATGLRFEWFRDDDGTRVGDAGSYYEVTAGLNYRPCEHLVVRPEIRGDWFDGVAKPFNNGHSDEQFSGGFDVIWSF
ncbi:MAG TPA: porin [Thermoguttaceae bacterium]|nr:porin [Thermoguttaceae bacterium]